MDRVERAAVVKARMRQNARNVLLIRFRARGGPIALAEPGVQYLLRRLWNQMQDAPTLEARKAAKERWIRIFSAIAPNLSTVKERVVAEKLGAAAETAQAKLEEARKSIGRRWHDANAWTLKLKESFPDWPDQSIKPLAEALTLPPGNRATIRKALFAGVGRTFRPLREWTTVRDALAEYRRGRDEASRRNQGLSQPPPTE
jgi:hypothetical protein